MSPVTGSVRGRGDRVKADQALPRYQRSAPAHAAPLWSATPAVAVRVAVRYGTVDPMLGAPFDPDHPRLSEPVERERLAARLEAGTRPPAAASNAYHLTRYHLAPALPLPARQPAPLPAR